MSGSTMSGSILSPGQKAWAATLLTCKNCKKKLPLSEFTKCECMFHPGAPVVNRKAIAWQGWDSRTNGVKNAPGNIDLNPGGFWWSCCRRKLAEGLGCVSKKHQEATDERLIAKLPFNRPQQPNAVDSRSPTITSSTRKRFTDVIDLSADSDDESSGFPTVKRKHNIEVSPPKPAQIRKPSVVPTLDHNLAVSPRKAAPTPYAVSPLEHKLAGSPSKAAPNLYAFPPNPYALSPNPYAAPPVLEPAFVIQSEETSEELPFEGLPVEVQALIRTLAVATTHLAWNMSVNPRYCKTCKLPTPRMSLIGPGLATIDDCAACRKGVKREHDVVEIE